MSEPIGDPLAVPPGFYDASGAIAVDHACKRCSYNLRTLREDSRCPECGTPVGLSVRGDLLRFADPDWVDKVALGLKIILWMILVSVIVGGVAAALGVVSPAGSAVLSLAAGAVAFYGVWLMTEPDPSGIGEDPNLTARKVVRVALVVGLLGQAAQTIAQTMGAGTTSAVSLALIAAPAMLVGLAGEFAKFIYYERLANRIPEFELADRARFLKWGYTVTLAILLLIAIPLIFTARAAGGGTGGPGMGFAVFGCIGGLAGLALLIFGIMTVLLLLRLRRSIAEQARLARESWASSPT